ncbi:hypothetical protein [Synechococcus sp. GFB01]|jgi:hypothetical protein|uniref:hypothetical protein n=1 Tax=Synechococcus sp. GFB01 TaxID=1662190 RepID=UPI00064E7929|nr:hypothetical protein [Synechococcus sp. GFB01]KMM17846.1 hypothetical protein SYNGFB01_01105 [Synechococcus sp. GFB01]
MTRDVRGTRLPWRGGADAWDRGAGGALVTAEFFGLEGPSPQGGGVEVWVAGAWLNRPVRVWLGGAWVEKPARRWSGSGWVLS